MEAQEIIERIMTAHWDMAACPCWVCKSGRELGFRPRKDYQRMSSGNPFPVPAFGWSMCKCGKRPQQDLMSGLCYECKNHNPKARLAKIMQDVEQLIIDKNYFNGIHPDIGPFDCEWERVTLDLAKKCEAAWQTPEFERRYAELMEHVLKAK